MCREPRLHRNAVWRDLHMATRDPNDARGARTQSAPRKRMAAKVKGHLCATDQTAHWRTPGALDVATGATERPHKQRHGPSRGHVPCTYDSPRRHNRAIALIARPRAAAYDAASTPPGAAGEAPPKGVRARRSLDPSTADGWRLVVLLHGACSAGWRDTERIALACAVDPQCLRCVPVARCVTARRGAPIGTHVAQICARRRHSLRKFGLSGHKLGRNSLPPVPCAKRDLAAPIPSVLGSRMARRAGVTIPSHSECGMPQFRLTSERVHHERPRPSPWLLPKG